MVNSVALVGGVLLALGLYAVIFLRMHSRGQLEMIDWFLISLGTFNGLGYAFVFWATSNGINSPGWSIYLHMYDNEIATIYLLSSLILGLSSIVGWAVFKGRKGSVSNYLEPIEAQTLVRIIKKTKLVAWAMLVLGAVSYALYARAYGGFSGLLSHSIAIRSGISRVYNPFSFLQRFGSLTWFASYLFFGILTDKSEIDKPIKGCRGGFMISVLFSIYVLYSYAGRVGALVYFGTFLLAYVLQNARSFSRLARKLVFVAIVFLVGLIAIDSVLGRSSNTIGVLQLFAKELSFPFASYVVQLGQAEYRLFKDIVVAPLFLLPKRIWSLKLNIDVATSFNTFLLTGARKGEAGVTGSIPVDMLTFSYMQASIFGVVVVGFLFGGILYWLERLSRCIFPRTVQKVLYSNFVLNVAMLSVLYGDPQHIIIRNFAMIAGLTVLSFVRRGYKNV
jgi:hypothetical protein